MTDLNPFRKTRIEFHILQTFPVTCLNRDDVGAPKSAIVGGVPRARVSSQCWKRNVRMALHELGVKVAVRTKRVAEVCREACLAHGASAEAAEKCAQVFEDLFSRGKEPNGKKSQDNKEAKEAKGVLFFFSRTEADALALYAAEKGFTPEAFNGKEMQKIVRKALKPAADGLDIALFGRMVAQAKDENLNVEAAASFAHAVSTHAVRNEIEFFTALDDIDALEKTGSGHMGSLEFNSATYYRYISLDLGELWETLGGEGMGDAVRAFVKALYIAVPAARQTTMSGACGWDYARVLVRKGQRLQLSFDRPVKARDGFLAPSIEALNEGLVAQKKMTGSLYGEIAGYTLSPESDINIDGLAEALGSFAENGHV